MERTFGAEIVNLFGVRLRRIYEPDKQGLPDQMLACLEQLARAEQSCPGLGDSASELSGELSSTRLRQYASRTSP